MQYQARAFASVYEIVGGQTVMHDVYIACMFETAWMRHTHNKDLDLLCGFIRMRMQWQLRDTLLDCKRLCLLDVLYASYRVEPWIMILVNACDSIDADAFYIECCGERYMYVCVYVGCRFEGALKDVIATSPRS